MTKKQFKILRLLTVIILSITIGVAVNEDIPYIPPLAILISALLIQFSYRKVDEIVADERDYKLAGQAARASFAVTTLALTALGGGLLAYSTNDPIYYRPGYLVLWIVCFMLVTNTISYLYYQKKA